jgi:hypothetical protein
VGKRLLKAFWVEFSALLPRLTGALILLILGWIVARVVRKMLIKILKFIRLDVAAEKTGVDDVLIQGGIHFTTVTILANLAYWFIILTVTLAVLNSFGLQSALEMFNKIVAYVPRLIVGVLVLMFGALFAKFVQGVASTYLNNIGIQGAQIFSTIAQWAVLIFIGSVALDQLAIGGQILASGFQIAFGALCFALALAFGLGGREWAAHILEKMWKK